MKRIFFSLLLISSFLIITAQEDKMLQQVNFNVGKTFSSFNYQDANGNKDENLSYASGNTYALSVGLGFGKKHLLRPEIIYSELGANSKFLSTPITWRLNYLGFSTAYLFKILQKETISISPGLILGYDYLLSGEQNMGSINYNLKESDIIKTWDINAGLLVNSRFKVTESMSLSFEYRFNMGLNQIEQRDEGEKTKNIAHRALIGLSFKL
ncbi:MAG: hypothetical protein ACK5D5_06540 [Bacteroidota bacterium]|jgi:hypothetical protein